MNTVIRSAVGIMPIENQPLKHLKGKLSDLRLAWAADWPGLPAILDESLAFLNLDLPRQSLDARTLLQCARTAAQLAEDSAYHLAKNHVEPSYHNRLHMADAITSLSCLLQLQRKEISQGADDWTAALMLAVVAHDLQHPGRVNTQVSELETKSFMALQPIMLAHQLDVRWQEVIQQLIVKTDPALVKDNHQTANAQPFQWNLDWACVLLNEADILASCLAEFGPGLGQALAHEWEIIDLPIFAKLVGTPEGRKRFLTSALFSSPASKVLQMDAELARQLMPEMPVHPGAQALTT